MRLGLVLASTKVVGEEHQQRHHFIKFVIMNTDHRTEIVRLLQRVCGLLEDSKESLLSPLSPQELILSLKCQIERLDDGLEIEKDKLIIEFLPTSTLQEISLSNGWGKEFITLAAKFDVLIHRV